MPFDEDCYDKNVHVQGETRSLYHEASKKQEWLKPQIKKEPLCKGNRFLKVHWAALGAKSWLLEGIGFEME